MRAATWIIAGGLVVLATGGGALWQYRAKTEAEAEAFALRVRHDEVERLTKENHRLASALPNESDLETLRRERATAAQLQGELTQLQQRAEAERAAAAAQAKKLAELPAIRRGVLSASDWHDVGRATPEAALETALWAAAGGRIDRFAESFSYGPGAKEKAETLFASLPEAMRSEFGSVDKLIALMSVQRVPIGGAQVMTVEKTTEGVTLGTRLIDPVGPKRLSNLTFRQEGNAWKLVVPAEAVDAYARKLNSPDGEPGGK